MTDKSPPSPSGAKSECVADRLSVDLPGAAGDVTDDFFLGDRLRVLQPRKGYRAGLDAILLASSCPGWPDNAHILDVGSGVGTVGLAVAARIGGARITLIEREPEMAALARANVQRNGFSERMTVVEDDLRRSARRATGMVDMTCTGQPALLGPDLAPASFDHVLANPPYNRDGHGRAATDPHKAVAHAMPADDLEQWARFLARMTRPGGTATLIHRADCLDQLLPALNRRFGGLRLLPLHSHANEPAIRIMIHGTKGSRAPLTLLPGLVLHAPARGFRPEIDAMLRAPLPLPAALAVGPAPRTLRASPSPTGGPDHS